MFRRPAVVHRLGRLGLIQTIRGGVGACAITAPCRLRRALGEALAAFLAVLDRYTLADLLGGAEGDEITRLLGLSAPAPPAEAVPAAD